MPPLTLINWSFEIENASTPSHERSHNQSRPLPRSQPNENPFVRNGLVIVVDDNKDAADSLAELFRILGYETLIAYNGTDGLALFSAMHPRFVFLDIAMPDMNGYEVVARMRDQESHDTVFTAVTGFGQENDKRHSREAGFDYHLTKPINLAEMRDILSKHS